MTGIYFEGAEAFGLDQADTYQKEMEHVFELLTGNPGMGLERAGIVPPIRTFFYGVHVIVYETTSFGIRILRVRHGRED